MTASTHPATSTVPPTAAKQNTDISPEEELIKSMRMTNNSRYKGAQRLKNWGWISFLTTTLLSLGLILIPLMQISGIRLRFEPAVLNMMQIFLAISVLLYSVIIGTARYEIRSIQMHKCADEVKELVRELRLAMHPTSSDTIDSAKLASIQKAYGEILRNEENHEKNDYRHAQIEAKNEQKVTGWKHCQLRIEAYFFSTLYYGFPLILLMLELTLITDMIGITSIFTEYLQIDPALKPAPAP